MTTTLRRGACPTLAEPMPTGDGLLARLPQPRAPLAADVMAGLCAAAREFGNGVIEVTSKGSLQVRGLRPETAAGFAASVTALEPALAERSPVVVGALAGLDPSEIIDVRPLAEAIRLAAATLALGPKVSVAVDGGGVLHLDTMRADVALRAKDTGAFEVRLAGRNVGTVPADIAAATANALLGMIASIGPEARGGDVDIDAARALAGGTIAVPVARQPAEPVGSHRLRGGTFAVGVGLPFGHANAAALAALACAADGARFMPAQNRTLLAIGLDERQAAAFLLTADRLDFIVDPNDARRLVIACTGAPGCASAMLSARGIARDVTAVLAPILAPGRSVHISGCGKGCANAGASSLTLVGRGDGYGLIRDGRVSDTPAAVIPAAALLRELGRIAAPSREPAHA